MHPRFTFQFSIGIKSFDFQGNAFDSGFPAARFIKAWNSVGSGFMVDPQFPGGPPSMFICARKVRLGFSSKTDQEACAIVLEEEIKKIRAGYVK